MKKIMVLCLYAVFISTCDHTSKTIQHLQRLAHVARQNGLDSLAESYLFKVRKLMQEEQKKSDGNAQQHIVTEAVHKAST